MKKPASNRISAVSQVSQRILVFYAHAIAVFSAIDVSVIVDVVVFVVAAAVNWS